MENKTEKQHPAWGPKISGLYTEVYKTEEEKVTALELRLDVDGERPLNVISGDIYSNLKENQNFLMSFRFQVTKRTKTATDEIQFTANQGIFDSDQNNFTKLVVTVSPKSQPLQLTIQWTDDKGIASKRLCEYKSPYFRTIQLEQDYEEGVMPFEPYDTAELLSSAPCQSSKLSLTDVYAAAGIEIILVRKRHNPVPHPKSIPGQGPLWTDDELHKAMQMHYTLLENKPHWAVWLFSASKYSISDVKGLVLSHKGKGRMGCVVFQKATGWQTAQEKRMQLFICVHELGHCFNLAHTWKNFRSNSSASINGYSTLSWMNYPWRYHLSEKVCGQKAFWKAFKFQFSDPELTHLRHGFRNDVIFGGNTFQELQSSKRNVVKSEFNRNI